MSRTWKRHETVKLINLYAQRRAELNKKRTNQKPVFKEIANEIPDRDGEACQKKMQQLLREYRNHAEWLESCSDVKKDPKMPKSFEPYFDLMAKVEKEDYVPEFQSSVIKEENIPFAEITNKELGRCLSCIATLLESDDPSLPYVEKFVIQLKECVYENRPDAKYCISMWVESSQQAVKTLGRFCNFAIDDAEFPLPASQLRASADNRTSAKEALTDSAYTTPDDATARTDFLKNPKTLSSDNPESSEFIAVDSESNSVGNFEKSILSPSKNNRFSSGSHAKSPGMVAVGGIPQNLSSEDASNLQNQTPNECTSSHNSCKPADVSSPRSCSVPPDANPTHITNPERQNSSPSSATKNHDLESAIMEIISRDENYSFGKPKDIDDSFNSNFDASGSNLPQLTLSEVKAAVPLQNSVEDTDPILSHDEMPQENQGNELLQQLSNDQLRLIQLNNRSNLLVPNPNAAIGNSVSPQPQSYELFCQKAQAIGELVSENRRIVNHSQSIIYNDAASVGTSFGEHRTSPRTSTLSTKRSKENYDSDVSSNCSSSFKRSKQTTKSVTAKKSKTKRLKRTTKSATAKKSKTEDSVTQRKALSKIASSRAAVGGTDSTPVPHPGHAHGLQEMGEKMKQHILAYHDVHKLPYQQGMHTSSSSNHQLSSGAHQRWDRSENMLPLHFRQCGLPPSAVDQCQTQASHSHVPSSYQDDHLSYFNNCCGNAPPDHCSVSPFGNTYNPHSYQNPLAYGGAPSVAQNSHNPPAASLTFSHFQAIAESLPQKSSQVTQSYPTSAAQLYNSLPHISEILKKKSSSTPTTISPSNPSA